MGQRRDLGEIMLVYKLDEDNFRGQHDPGSIEGQGRERNSSQNALDLLVFMLAKSLTVSPQGTSFYFLY